MSCSYEYCSELPRNILLQIDYNSTNLFQTIISCSAVPYRPLTYMDSLNIFARYAQ